MKRAIIRKLKLVKFHPYKINLHQEFMMGRIDQNAHFISLIVFTGESTE